MFWIMGLLVLNEFVLYCTHCLDITDLRVPREATHEALLDCRYDLGEAELYDVKWYKDSQQFFRCSRTDGNEYPVAGVRIHNNNKYPSIGSCSVLLINLSPASDGEYECEVTAEAPKFNVVSKKAKLKVVLQVEDERKITDYQDINESTPKVVKEANTTWNAYSSTESGAETDKNKIVDEHNKYRLLLAQGKVTGQPKATNMKRMVWDGKLAVEAQKIANTLEFEHKKVNDDRWFVGQNLYWSWNTSLIYGAHWPDAVKWWFDEVKDYKFGSSFSFPTSHYTQVVWANTTYVGCGYTLFSRDNLKKFEKFYVCNYGPGGNIFDENPYSTSGSGCENLC